MNATCYIVRPGSDRQGLVQVLAKEWSTPTGRTQKECGVVLCVVLCVVCVACGLRFVVYICVFVCLCVCACLSLCVVCCVFVCLWVVGFCIVCGACFVAVVVR